MFVVDVMSRVPVYEQIIKQVEEQVLTGILKEGDKLPSVRSLSVKLSINPNTIQKAYTELDRRQLIITVPGKGSFISEKAIEVVGANSREKMTEIDIKEYSLVDLRRHIGTLEQETFLFNDTIANNIALGKPKATKEEIINNIEEVFNNTEV